VFQEANRLVKSSLILCDETMDMFGYLTKDVPTPFYCESLGDRVASMLNHNLMQLCGPKCVELKVKDAANRYHWKPRELLSQIVHVYLNLFSKEFCMCIANDGRSYAPEKFSNAVAKIRNVLDVSTFERFQHLANAVAKKYEEIRQEEEDFGDDIPNDYLCALMMTLMLDPVKLPSGTVVDRKNILRHLLSTPIDPFSRLPCTENDLIPLPELKAEINEWMKARRDEKRKS